MKTMRADPLSYLGDELDDLRAKNLFRPLREHSAPQAVHTVKITIHPDQPDKVKILDEWNGRMDDPKRFDGTTWYAGAILLIGDLQE